MRIHLYWKNVCASLSVMLGLSGCAQVLNIRVDSFGSDQECGKRFALFSLDTSIRIGTPGHDVVEAQVASALDAAGYSKANGRDSADQLIGYRHDVGFYEMVRCTSTTPRHGIVGYQKVWMATMIPTKDGSKPISSQVETPVYGEDLTHPEMRIFDAAYYRHTMDLSSWKPGDRTAELWKASMGTVVDSHDRLEHVAPLLAAASSCFGKTCSVDLEMSTASKEAVRIRKASNAAISRPELR